MRTSCLSTIRMTLVTGAGALAALAAAAQNTSPTVGIGAQATISHPKPTLVAPAPGEHVQSTPSASASVIFRWQHSSTVTPARFILCITPAGAPCDSAPSSAMLIEVPGTSTQRQTLIAAALHDRPLEWNVAACGPATNPRTFARAGITNCSWSKARALTVGYEPPLITLISPRDGEHSIDIRPDVGSVQRFTWSAPPNAAADEYRLCIAVKPELCARPSLACDEGTIVRVLPGQSFADVPVIPLTKARARTLIWTVASCKDGSCGLAANQPTRRYTVPAYHYYQCR